MFEDLAARKAELASVVDVTQSPLADGTGQVWNALGIAVAMVVVALFLAFVARLLNGRRAKEK